MLRRKIFRAALLLGLATPSVLIMTSCRPHDDYGMKKIIYLPGEATVTSLEMQNLIKLISEKDFMNFYKEVRRITDDSGPRPEALEQLFDSGDAKLIGPAKITSNDDGSNLVEFRLDLYKDKLSLWDISILLIPSKERVDLIIHELGHTLGLKDIKRAVKVAQSVMDYKNETKYSKYPPKDLTNLAWISA